MRSHLHFTLKTKSDAIFCLISMQVSSYLMICANLMPIKRQTRNLRRAIKMKFLLLAVLLLACGSVATQAQSCLTQDDVR